jgi:hypothetical protein
MAAGLLASPNLQAQSTTMHGYITAVHPPDSFDVNGEHVTTTAETRFGQIDLKTPVSTGSMPDTVQIGAWVEVTGKRDRNAKTMTAYNVLIRNDGDRKLSGLAVIDQVVSTAPELVVAADGYRIRVTAATDLHYPKDAKSAADVRAGMWVLYEGKIGQDGLLVASKARFLSTNHAKEKSGTAPGNSSLPAATPQPPNEVSNESDDQIDDRRTEVDLDDVTYGISKDQALQSRVRRIGMRLVPAWEKQLPPDDPAKIQFEFIAVKNQMRDEQSSSEGLILVPAKLVERFRNDDQLAAVLADGIAYSLQQKAPWVIQMNRANLERAGAMAAANLVPYAGLVASSVYTYEAEKALKEQRWRMALELMADAGYDPWQAPEAWRLAAPGKLPADTSTLKYSDQGGYQFAILNLTYKKPTPANATESGSTSEVGTSRKP